MVVLGLGDELLLVGRVLFAIVFLYNGYNNIVDEGMVEYSQYAGLPAASILTRVGGILILLAGLGILVGAAKALSAIVLFVFLIVAAVIFHDFWAVDDPQDRVNQLNHFLKNLAMAGGALAFLYISDQTWAYALNQLNLLV